MSRYSRFAKWIVRFWKNRVKWSHISLLVAWPLLFFWPATLARAVFDQGDILAFFAPTHAVYANALREGRLPLWSPEMAAGFPLFAEGQIGGLYPPNLLLYGLLPLDSAINYSILLHLAWASVGTFLFVRTLKLQPASAVLAAFAFGSGGFFYARLPHMSVLATAAWLPWLMWAWEKYDESIELKQKLPWFILLVLFIGVQLLAGHPQFAFMSELLLLAYALFCSRSKLGGSARFWLFEYVHPTKLIVAAIALVGGVALAAAQLLPLLELSGFTARAAGTDPVLFNMFSLQAFDIAMLFYPFAVQNPYPAIPVEVIGYIGLLPILLALASPFVGRNRQTFFFILTAILSLLFGLGEQTPLYPVLYHLPLFSLFRIPGRFLFLMSFALAILAAITFDHLIQSVRSAVGVERTAQLMFVVWLFSIAGVTVLARRPGMDQLLTFIRSFVPLLFPFLAIGILVTAWRKMITRPVLVIFAIGFTVFDLALFAAAYARTTAELRPVADFFSPPESLPVLSGLTARDGRVLPSLQLYPSVSTVRAGLFPDISLLYNIPSAWGYSPLTFKRMQDYFETLTPAKANLMGIRYYLIPQAGDGKDYTDLALPNGNTIPLEAWSSNDLKLALKTDRVSVFENPDALPRVLLVYEAHIVDDDVARTKIDNPDFRPDQIVMLASGTAIRSEKTISEREKSQIMEYRPEHIVVSVDAERDAYVLLTDSWYPGWIALVDGKETPIERADLIFRAVFVSQGNHVVEFKFRPLSFYWGSVISLVTLTTLAGLWAITHRRSAQFGI